MEYLQGESLDRVIAANKPLHITEKLDILVQVCNGLNYAHKCGVIHRDIKPANIVILKNGSAKIVDFGIAQVGASRLTRTGMVVGSIHYMSPEQVGGKIEVDRRSDLYSAGVVLFQLLTGVLPFEGKDTSSTLLKIVQDPPPSITKYLDPCPPGLDSIVMKALAKDRAERYDSADDFALDLARLQGQLNRERISEHLAQATQALEQRQFEDAKRLLFQVLRADPHNGEAKSLLREMEFAIETHKRKQKAQRLLSEAKEAFARDEHEGALQHIDEGLNADAGNAELLALRAQIVKQREETARYKDWLNHAEAAFGKDDLEEAAKAIAQAVTIRPDEFQARALQMRIANRIQECRRQSEADQSARQFALSVNAVERAMADARMLVFLNQRREAVETLDNVANHLARVPLDIQSQWQALRQEVLKNSDPAVGEVRGTQPARFEPPVSERNTHAETQEMPLSNFPATSLLFGENSRGSSSSTPGESSSSSTVEDGRAYATPEELREFLPQAEEPRSRAALWITAIALLIAVVAGWLFVWPKLGQPGKRTLLSPAGTYAQINAEPWGTVKEIRSPDGRALVAPNEPTPVRLRLPPGRYTALLGSPNGDERELAIEVPATGGNSYFVVFAQPDLDAIISSQ